jgi:Ca2+-binding RTX toxin-like protein
MFTGSKSNRTRTRVRRAAVVVALVGALGVPLALSQPAGAEPVYCLGHLATIVGTPGNDALDGTDGPDIIAGLDGNDVIRGFGGNDVICGGDGNNIYDGGADSDLMAGGGDGDSFFGGDGEDEVTYAEAPYGVDADLSLRTSDSWGDDVYSSVEDLTGSAYDDFLIGDGGSNRLVGLDGSDYLMGNDGDDVLVDGGHHTYDVNQFIGGNGYDLMYGGKAIDVANFNGSMLGVNVDLTQGTATGQGNDLLSGMDDVIGTIYNDAIRGDANANVLNGNAGDDKITGEGGDDWLEGGGDNDQLTGGPGNDAALFTNAFSPVVANLATGRATGEGTDTLSTIEGLLGGPGNDRLTGAATNDTLDGGPGDDQLDGAGGADIASFASSEDDVTADLQAGKATGAGTDTLVRIEGLQGGGGEDVLRGNAGPNRLIGGYLDRLEGRQGDDVLDNRSVNTEITYESAPGGVTVNAGTGVVTGAAGNDRILHEANDITGSPFADRISCKPTSDYGCSVFGLAGNDVIAGSAGPDYFVGGPGNDRFDGLADGATVTYERAPSAVTVNLTTGTATGGEGQDTLAHIDTVIGTRFNDQLTGPKGVACTLDGYDGNDRLDASTANGCYLSGGRGNDTIIGSPGKDEINAQYGKDVIDARAGDDTVSTAEAGDDVEGGTGTDTLDLTFTPAPVTLDLTVGAPSPAVTFAATGFEAVVGTGFDDTIRGTALAEDIDGSGGNDTIIGRNGDDHLEGNVGNDSIYGLLGNDTIDGGIGDDVIDGGGGADTCAGGGGTDTLTSCP